MKELIIKKGDKQITVADKEDVMDALDNKSDNTHNHDSTYIKKTGGVSQNSNGNIIIPSNADSTNVDATGYIPFGHTIQDTTKTLREILPTKKSVIGAVISKGATGNQYDYVISARHRNGSYDGYKYGMYIRAPWSPNGNLSWAESNNGDYGTEKTILDSSNYSNYANKTTVTDNLTTNSSTNALSAKQGKILNDRYKGVTLASSGTNTAKPYYRLFHIASGSGDSRSSRLIFEISSKTSTAYAKFAVYMRQNTSTSASTIAFQCLEKVGFDLNSISVGFRNNHPNTCCDIYINVQSMVHYVIKVIDDQLREGTYTQYSPTEGNIEAYTSVANAGTQLYGSAYTNIINPKWDIVATTIQKADGTSSQFLKADGSVDTLADNLTTDSSTKALSAKQGKWLNDNKADKGDYYCAIGNSGQYVQMFQIKLKGGYGNVGISFDIYQRKTSPLHCDFLFSHTSQANTQVASFTYTGKNTQDIYAYKVADYTWNIAVKQTENNGAIQVANLTTANAYMKNKVDFSSVYEVMSVTPDTTNSTKAIYADYANQVEYITSTHGTSTSTWTGTSNVLTTLQQGTIIYYRLDQDPTSSNVTLNLTLANGSTTGAKNVFIAGTQVTNQFPKTSVLHMIYTGYAWHVINPVPNTTTATVTYTDGSTGTINFVTR